MTKSFTPEATSLSITCKQCCLICAMGRLPYGPFAVSPTYIIASCGIWSRMVLATVNPPTPESKIPIGAVLGKVFPDLFGLLFIVRSCVVKLVVLRILVTKLGNCSLGWLLRGWCCFCFR